MNDDVSITALLHKYGALAFWDYAAAAPYVKIDMNPQVSLDLLDSNQNNLYTTMTLETQKEWPLLTGSCGFKVTLTKDSSKWDFAGGRYSHFKLRFDCTHK